MPNSVEVTIPIHLLRVPETMQAARERAILRGGDVLLERVQRQIKARAYRTGDLYRGARVFHPNGDANQIGVQDDVFYAGFIQRGTTNADGSVRMAARPVFTDALDEATPEIVRLFNEEYARAFGGAR